MLDLDPQSPAFRADPYPAYHALRAHAPVVRVDRLGGWVLTRHRDVHALLRDNRFSADRTRSATFPGLIPDPVEREKRMKTIRASLLNSDPPQHTRLRALVAKAFTPQMIERLRPRVVALVAEILDAAAARGEMDVVAELAVPLPVTVIATMLGVPPEDHARFAGWSADLAASLDTVLTRMPTERTAIAVAELMRYLGAIADARRAAPKDDLISALVAVEEAGDRLDTNELLGLCRLLLVAGHETTTNLVSNGLLALTGSPDDLARLRDPAVLASAVEEMLRYDSPVQLTTRVALADTELPTGEVVRTGEIVIGVIGAANRDPEVFTEPDRFDVARADNKHLAFGHGIHFCLGAPLARLEAQVAFAAMAERFARVELAAEPVRRATMVLRGLSEMKVRLTTR